MTHAQIVDSQLEHDAREKVLVASRERELRRVRQIDSLRAQIDVAEKELERMEGIGAAEAGAKLDSAIDARHRRLPGVPYTMQVDEAISLDLISYVRFRATIVQRRHQLEDLRRQLHRAEED